MRARAGIVSLALGIVGGAMALAHAQDAERAGAADAIRLRAEELAQAASRRFDEVMGEKQTRLAQAQGQPPAGKASSTDDPLAPFVRWLERSNREYQTLMRRLSQGSAAPGGGTGTPRRRQARRDAGGREQAPGGRHDRGPGGAHQGAVPVHHAAARRGRRPAAQERAGRASAGGGVGQAAREEGREGVGGRQAPREAGGRSEGGGGAAAGRDASGGGDSAGPR